MIEPKSEATPWFERAVEILTETENGISNSAGWIARAHEILREGNV